MERDDNLRKIRYAARMQQILLERLQKSKTQLSDASIILPDLIKLSAYIEKLTLYEKSFEKINNSIKDDNIDHESNYTHSDVTCSAGEADNGIHTPQRVPKFDRLMEKLLSPKISESSMYDDSNVSFELSCPPSPIGRKEQFDSKFPDICSSSRVEDENVFQLLKSIDGNLWS